MTARAADSFKTDGFVKAMKVQGSVLRCQPSSDNHDGLLGPFARSSARRNLRTTAAKIGHEDLPLIVRKESKISESSAV
jgi:hypothetical protein